MFGGFDLRLPPTHVLVAAGLDAAKLQPTQRHGWCGLSDPK